RHLKKMFGPPEAVHKNANAALKDETDGYPQKGFAATFVNKKIQSVGTIPPLKLSISKPFDPEEIQDYADFAIATSDTNELPNIAPKISSEVAANAVLTVSVCVTIALAILKSEDDKAVEAAFAAFDLARAILDRLANGTQEQLVSAIHNALKALLG